MNLNRTVFSAALCATLVVGVNVAEAVNAGRFTGQTGAKDPVGFRVNGSNRVYDFFFQRVRLTCNDGDSFTTSPRNASPGSARYRVRSNRRFTVHRTSTRNGFGWTAKGRFTTRGGSASGTLRVLARFDDENELTPSGKIRCQSRLLSWTARRR